MTTGEGGHGRHRPTPAVKERIDSERNQGRAPDMGWLDHDRLGFNYRLSDIACALGLAQLERLDDMLAGRARVAGLYREALAGIEGLGLPCEDARRRRARLVRLRRPGAARRRPRRRRSARCASAASRPSPTCPAIHLMSFYRERFGHREGEFPVCEDVAARSLALPFFPEMTEGQVDRGGAAALRRPSLGPLASAAPMSRFAEPQHRAFRALNRSLGFDRRLWPYDVAQSRAHARMLAAQGIIADDDRDALLAGARRRRGASSRAGTFPFARRRRGHPHGDRAAA